MDFLSIKTKDATAVNKIQKRESNIEIGGLNVLADEIKTGGLFFIVFGGDKPAWDTGLAGIGMIIKEPYDIGYNGNNFRIRFDVKLLLERTIKRNDLVPYKDTYGTIGIAPITKWEPNQALSRVPEANSIALLRAMLEIDPSCMDDMKSIIPKEVMDSVLGYTNRMVEIPTKYGESINTAVRRYVSTEEASGSNDKPGYEKDILNPISDINNGEAFRIWLESKFRNGPEANVEDFDPHQKSYSHYLWVESVEVKVDKKRYKMFFVNDPDIVEKEIERVKGKTGDDIILALNEYKEFLIEKNQTAEIIRPKNCLEVKRVPRQNRIHPINLIIYGAPGTGKTYSTAEYALAIVENREVDFSPKGNDERKAVMEAYNDLIRKGQVVFTTFHQSYGYEEFIQGLRPDISSDKMVFKTVDGVFKEIADRALDDHINNYVIIIDEINRANISKVFGELITLVEEDKRWGEVNQLCATLQSGDVFAVPNNLYIVGTMNSADKSISLIDAALRRRFDFVEQKPQPELISNDVLRKLFKALNKRLAGDLKSTDLLIGHSYFINKTEEDLPNILNRNVIPLLYEYYYDDRKRVESALSEAIKGANVSIVNEDMGRLSVKKNG